MVSNQRGRVLWISNVPTPYRAPLWSAIAESHELTVALMAETEPNRHWDIDLTHALHETVFLNAKALATSGDSVIYGPSFKLLKMINERPRAIIIDGWESPAYMVAHLWARMRRVPVIVSYRSTIATHRYTRGPVPIIRQHFFRGADLVLTAGQSSTQSVRDIGIPQEKIVEGFNTVDVARFAEAVHIRSGLIEPIGHHYLYVGQLIDRKNVDSLMRAFAVAHEPHDTLTLVGTGPEEGSLRSLAHTLGLGAEVEFAGHLDGDQLVKAYSVATTLVLPSRIEVWGLVANEALAAGLQVVVSNTCGIAPSIRNMPGVITSDPEPTELADALRESKKLWAGPLSDHPITLHTPKRLATVVLQSVERVAPVR